MNKDKYLSSLVAANYKTAVWMIGSGILLCSNLMLVVFLFGADLTEKTIILPPDVTKPFSIHLDKVSPSYIEQMTRYFSQLLLTYHKANVDTQFDTILRHVHPRAYANLKAALHAKASRVQRHLIGSVFHPMGIHVSKMKATINGELISMIGKKIISRTQNYYEFEYAYRNGSFYLIKFQQLALQPGNKLTPVEIEGNEPEPQSESELETS